MSLMCTAQACKAKGGPCGHEKMMMVMVVAFGVLGGIGHWALNWF